MCDKRDRAITCVLCRDPHLTVMFSGIRKHICLKESEVWRKVISNKIIVTFVKQGFLSTFLSPPVAYVEYLRGDEWSIKIFNCSKNFTFARFARKI